jgi:hypothetical protein
MDQWPALGKHGQKSRAWKNISYFRRVAGYRTVPIEVRIRESMLTTLHFFVFSGYLVIRLVQVMWKMTGVKSL